MALLCSYDSVIHFRALLSHSSQSHLLSKHSLLVPWETLSLPPGDPSSPCDRSSKLHVPQSAWWFFYILWPFWTEHRASRNLQIFSGVCSKHYTSSSKGFNYSLASLKQHIVMRKNFDSWSSAAEQRVLVTSAQQEVFITSPLLAPKFQNLLNHFSLEIISNALLTEDQHSKEL